MQSIPPALPDQTAADELGEMPARFVCFFYLQAFGYIQLGIHIDLYSPNVEIHIPFGMLRIGLDRVVKHAPRFLPPVFRAYGWTPHGWEWGG